jgi:hypothetical protein
MNSTNLIRQLENQAQVIRFLSSGLISETARWKPAADSWSVLEVINHLHDEELEDFRGHFDDLFNRLERPWRRINPGGWVTERMYNQRELQPSLKNFLQARQESIDWLENLKNPDWQASMQAPWGTISAGDLLVSWAAHDLLHIRQLTELNYALLGQAAQPYHIQYAGDW